MRQETSWLGQEHAPFVGEAVPDAAMKNLDRFEHGCSPSLMPFPREVFLVRHGQSVWNRTKRVTGQLNPDRSKEGEEQARRLEPVRRDAEPNAIDTGTPDRTVSPHARDLGRKWERFRT